MKKLLTLIFLSITSFCQIHAEITWTLSNDGTLTISGTDMPNYYYEDREDERYGPPYISNIPWVDRRYGIKKVVIEDGVTNIGDYAFYDCTNLASVTIPNSVTSIGSAFYGCSRLTSITIPESVKSIGTTAFYGCSSLTSITIPESVTSIGSSAFNSCSGLTSITIPNSVTSIGSSAFSGCSGLTSITIPESVTSIGAYAFSGCHSLTSVSISMKNIPKNIFNGFSGLTSVTISENVTNIGEAAFRNCSGLTSITIPNSVTSIGNSAFSGCSGITSVTISEGVTSIGTSAFSDCKGLTSVTIPSSVTSIDGGAFSGCDNLVDLKYNAKNAMLSTSNTILSFPISIKTVTIGNDVEAIPAYFIYGNTNVTSITIPYGVASIGNSAFCKCSGLASVTIPNSVTSVGNSAFAECNGLTSITIPNSVTSIGSSALANCYGIREIYSLNAAPPKADDAFTGMNTQHAKLFVPEGTADAYKYAHGWMDFLNIYETTYSTVQTPAESITISDNMVEIAKGYYKEKTVTYVREGDAISKDYYASFCLPFAVDPNDAQFKAVYVPLGIALYNTDANTLRIGFYKEDKMISAGTPFLALLAVDNKVEIKNALPVSYDQEMPAVKTSVVRTYNFNDHNGIMSENSNYAINFSGTYKQASPANANTFNADGSVWASASVAPYRAYVVLTKNNTNARIISSFDDETISTGIKKLQITNDKSFVYDLNGRMVNKNALKAGIYIKNGKKVVVK